MTPTNSIALLTKLVQLDTVGGNELQTASFLDEYLTAHHIHHQLLEVEPNRFNVVADIGPDHGPIVVLEGHQDVVALGDLRKWHHLPLGAEQVEHQLYGRGASDMKSGLAAAIITMIDLAHDPSFTGHVRLLATIGEESSPINHMQGAQYFAQHGYMKNVTAMIVAEPSSVPINWLTQTPIRNPLRFSKALLPSLVAANRSTEQFVLNFAHKGSITFAVTAKGLSAHSSTPELGINAIDALIAYSQNQRTFFDSLTAINPVLGKTVAVTTKFSGGQQLNSVPDEATLYEKVRTIPEVPNSWILDRLNALIADQNRNQAAHLTLQVLGDKRPVESDPQDRFIQLLQDIAQQELHQTIPTGGSAAGTDASELTKANPDTTVVVFGPGNMTAHQVDEYVDLDIFEAFVTIYERVLTTYFE